MWIRALRLAAKRPLAALLLVLSIAAALVALGVTSLRTASEREGDDQNPRLLIGRAWLDRMPEKSTDVYDFWVFLGGGIVFHEKGARFQGSYELFDMERRGSSVDLVQLHTKKKLTTRFTVKRCPEKRPFDLCLVLHDMPGGPLELYGWGDDDDADAAAPWANVRRKAAEALARTRSATRAIRSSRTTRRRAGWPGGR
jgi:hypothetical protein